MLLTSLFVCYLLANTFSKRDIPEQNFQMHEIHCQRNLRLCAKCDEAIPRSEMEEHMADFHALVECKCKLKIEKAQLEKHEVK